MINCMILHADVYCTLDYIKMFTDLGISKIKYSISLKDIWFKMFTWSGVGENVYLLKVTHAI